ncbi:ShlB/FhaC/HecB family hemolysin secretion/activation protein [Pseudomonas xantholysinigenes]|uniref:ShlB/FhaC/HecB family hemolysin secretion/activation protein n=2 Tax=Pseudomonas xantholysinigenes TaxID=2745490 RepID=A0A9E6TWR7_9PSED|nr:ShlB/FhaC/HecB family hemolysin secretion/activation protein [Pseudomonas xantholysinigenes]
MLSWEIPHRVILCAAMALLPLTSLKADPASQQLREQQQGLHQQERLQQLERWQRAPLIEPHADYDTANPRRGSRCWSITGVRLDGNRHLGQAQLQPVVQALSQPCMGVADIQRLLVGLTQRYVEAGYPTARPYLARYPEHGQPLDITLVEGFIESIELADPDLPLSLRGAFPDIPGNALYLPDLEQGLDQLNRLRAYDLGIELLPGTQLGGTRVIVEPRRVSAPWHLDARFDNRGSALTGRHRLSLGLGLDSPLGLNDDLRLSLVSTVFDAPGRSQGASLYYGLPYGPWTFSLNASQMRYHAPLAQTRFTSSGQSELFALGSERVLWRNQRGMLSASARVEHKQLTNHIGRTLIALQSPTLSSVEAGLNLLWLDHGLWSAYAGVSQGVDWFGADQPLPDARAPRPDFTKYRANLLHLRQGSAQWPWHWQSELALQYSRDLLPAVEQVQLTDHTAVRGFRQHTMAGASAAVWRNTLSQPLPLDWARPLQMRPSIGLDIGWTRFSQDSPSQRLASASAGLELTLPPTSRLRLDYQQALYASDRPTKTLEKGFWVMEWTLAL